MGRGEASRLPVAIRRCTSGRVTDAQFPLYSAQISFGQPLAQYLLCAARTGRSSRVGFLPTTEVAALRICDAAAAAIEGSGIGSPDSWRKSLKGRHPFPPRSLHVSRSGRLLQRHRLSAPRGRRGRRAQSSKPNPLYSKRSSTVRSAADGKCRRGVTASSGTIRSASRRMMR
jgi:hypothetical protein